MLFGTFRSHIGFSALLASILLLTSCAKKQGGPQVVAPIRVTVATVERRNVSLYGDWVATLDGFVNAQIQPQVSGYMIKQDYREGAYFPIQNLLKIRPSTSSGVIDPRISPS